LGGCSDRLDCEIQLPPCSVEKLLGQMGGDWRPDSDLRYALRGVICCAGSFE
jgi:hypothetical protein